MGWMGEPVQQHLMPLKKYEELDREEKNSLLKQKQCANSFSNLHKRCLACKERDTLQVCYPLCSMVRLSVLSPENPHP